MNQMNKDMQDMHEAFGVGPLQVFVSHSWHGGIFHLKRGVNRGWPEMHQRRNLYCCPLNGFSCGLLLVFRKDFGMFFFSGVRRNLAGKSTQKHNYEGTYAMVYTPEVY